MLDRNSRIGFIGAGQVGKSMAAALSRKGYKVVASASRTFASAESLAHLVPGCVAYRSIYEAASKCDMVFITGTDASIAPIAASIKWRKGQGVAHCSGATSTDVFALAKAMGAVPGAFHPLQTFSDVEKAVASLPGTTFAIEGEEEMRAYLKEMALALGGVPIFLRAEDKALYHCTVVMMGGILNGLCGAIAGLWQENFGIDRNQALKSLAPIMQGTAATLASLGLPAAAAGPYVRGDAGTVRKHMNALREFSPEMVPVYCNMALAAFPVALEKGNVSAEKAEEIRQLLQEGTKG
ncbi:MAG: DUF2520 domain-containing protein [SAR202 cluster bacterium]|nr:DUF2520 domain-containing protein [SAR202 cluster bacterium]